MSKIIYKDKATEAKLKNSQGAKNVYINFDAIAELPDEYEVVISEVRFDPLHLETSFSPVGGGSYMPKPELMYEIAEACGISGTGNPMIEPIIEEVDINPMLGKPIGTEPMMRKMTVGRRVTKTSQRIQEDGTPRTSSPCTCDYNAWERSLIQWAEKPQDYNTPEKKNLGFLKELKFAHAKAETKAYEKSIRELAYLQTGYKAADLAEGVLYFAKIRRSAAVLKLETAARLDAIRNGGQQLGSPRQPAQIEAPATATSSDDFALEAEVVQDEPVPLTEREQMHKDLSDWKAAKLIPPLLVKSADNILVFLERDEPEKQIDKWEKAKRVIQQIRDTIPAGVLGKKEEDIF
jgi:hypothetical protein